MCCCSRWWCEAADAVGGRFGSAYRRFGNASDGRTLVPGRGSADPPRRLRIVPLRRLMSVDMVMLPLVWECEPEKDEIRCFRSSCSARSSSHC